MAILRENGMNGVSDEFDGLLRALTDDVGVDFVPWHRPVCDQEPASLKFGPSAKTCCFTKGRSKWILNTIALISPFGTHQVALEPALPVRRARRSMGCILMKTRQWKSRKTLFQKVWVMNRSHTTAANFTELTVLEPCTSVGDYQFGDLSL